MPATPRAKEELAPWPEDRPVHGSFVTCSAQRMAAPRSRFVPGCAQSACVDLDGYSQVCSCVPEDPGRASSMRVVRGGVPVLEWRVPIPRDPSREFHFHQGGVADFDVVRADPDADGAPEWVVAHLRDRNDVGMSTWDVALVEATGPAPRAVTLEVANYGEGTLVGSGGGRCDLLATEWSYGWEAGREPIGWYLAGRRMAYAEGQLVPVPGAPILRRRLLYSFAPGSVGLGAGFAVGTPAADFAHPSTVARAGEWAAEGVRTGERSATIRAVAVETDGIHQGLRLVLEEGAALGTVWGDLPSYQRYTRLGDARTGLLYPLGDVPGDPSAALIGKKVRIASYMVDYWEERQIAWLEPS
ncbi:MAG: hypothetical protein JRJ84_23875 [Deltaproteobacteria bacterium]|nr:hypothetical protein [Deltaproteobacteria bacterium]